MANVALYSQEGKQLGEITLNDAIFGIEVNQQAIFDAVIMQRASMRQGTHKVKNRREVAGGGRKPWKQKGTGRARQGSIRSPQWRGGGIVFGPTPRNYGYRLNKKVSRLALKSVLSEKVLLNELLVVDAFKFETVKTKQAVEVFKNLECDRKTLVVASYREDFENTYLSMRNVDHVLFMTSNEINVYDLVNANKLVLTSEAIKDIEEALA